MSRKRPPNREPDVEIGAGAKARKLRFRSKPKTNVEFEGRTRVRTDDGVEDIELDSDSQTERRNLPEEVEPGVTYRDVAVRWRLAARLEDPPPDRS